MRAVIVGAGMGGLMTALALRQSGAFSSIDVYEQTKEPTTAGAGLNIPPNGARICRWLGVDLDGGNPKGPQGAIDGGRAAILVSSRQFNEDGSMTERPFDHVTAAGDGAGFHHMHRLDLLMCLYKRVFEFGPDSGKPCPIAVHMDSKLTGLRQTRGRRDRDLFEWPGRNGRYSRGCRRDQLRHIGVGVAELAPQTLDRGDLLSWAHSTGGRCCAPQGRRQPPGQQSHRLLQHGPL